MGRWIQTSKLINPKLRNDALYQLVQSRANRERPIRLDDRGHDSCAHRHHARQSQGNGGKRVNGKDVNGKRNAKSYSPTTRHKLPDPVPGTR